MPNERSKKDANFIPVISAVTNDAEQNIRQLRVDPTTGRLLISGTAAAGTEYTEGSVAAIVTGIASMWRDTGDIIRVASTARPFPVNVVAGGVGGGIAQIQVRNAANVWTDVGLATGNLNIPVSGTFWQATQPVSGTFWQATQPVSGTFWQATQPISGNVGLLAGANNIGNVGLLAGTNNIGNVGVLTLPPLPAGINNIGNVGVITLPAIPTGANAIGRVGHDIITIGDGRRTVATAGTRETLAASTPCKRVIITAGTNNTNLIVIGGSTVVAALATRSGTPLAAGDSFSIDIDNLAKIFIDVVTSGEGCTFTFFN